MTSPREALYMLDGIIAEEAIEGGNDAEAVSQRVKKRIGELKEGLVKYIPLEHIKKLVKLKLKQKQLIFAELEPNSEEEVKKILTEMREIREDILKSRPEFLVVEKPICKN